MFHMLSAFTLSPDKESEFTERLDAYLAALADQKLVYDALPLARRVQNTILDTDDERGQSHYMVMRFTGKAQADAAIEWIESGKEPVQSLHRRLYALVQNAVFTCWEDIEP